ncbi:hypothetical protein PF327_11230 [Sulfurovum sp. XTW-4]|uniref:Uncharacterized protein n=1 Tax=Sulfurovum xiamenensis TaxID=3019066 RepID=A0ABT7QUK3_9BACT|nr:hypothetical protein [Sulfurovum xiamenensis]MDM5264767.1 hypothetical protein [Sulfurovum xiamenensis]
MFYIDYGEFNMEGSYSVYFTYGSETNSKDFFNGVASFIVALDNLNNAIAKSFGGDVETEIYVTHIEGGSVRAYLRDVLKKLPDDKIHSIVTNPKDEFAKFLIDTKYKIIDYTNKTPNSFNKQVVKIIEDEIDKTPLREYGYSVDKNKVNILKSVGELSSSIKKLPATPLLELGNESAPMKGSYEFKIEEVEDVTKHIHQIRQQFIIKKPDIFGDSKWTIIFDKNIDVSILDDDFKQKIRNRELSISYGDMLDADLLIETYLDQNIGIVDVKYSITKVYGIIEPTATLGQDTLFQ